MSPSNPLRRKPAPGAGPPTGEQPVAGQGGLDGIRAWLSELDRRLRVRSWIAIALAAVGIGAGAAGIVLAQQASDDAATKEDLNEVLTKITTVEQTAQQAAAEDIAAAVNRLDGLEAKLDAQIDQINRNKSEIRVANDDIEDLRGDIADLTDRVSDLEAAADSEPAGDGGGGTSGN